MKLEFDSTGFKFVLKFATQVAILYLLALLIPGFVFDNSYSDVEYVSGISEENLASVIIHNNSAPDNTIVTLGFVGDIMLDRGVEKVVSSYGGGDFKFVFEHVQEKLNEFDILFGNLEGPISDKGRELGALYSFRMDPGAVDGLLHAGFDVLSLSNNHSGDWGREAIRDSINRLNVAGIGSVGTGLSPGREYEPLIFEKGGLKVAYLAFTESVGIYGGGDVALARVKKVRETVESLKSAGSADFIVVYFHFGDEYQSEPNDRQRSLSHTAIDAGADLVIGSHPHVTQGIEKYKDSFIFYSLGNFVFDQYFSDETMQGWLLKVSLENTGRISGLEICNVFINSLFQPSSLVCTS